MFFIDIWFENPSLYSLDYLQHVNNLLLQAPSSLLEALEGHLANLEGRKPGSGGTTPTQGGHKWVQEAWHGEIDALLIIFILRYYLFLYFCRVNVAAAVNVLNTTSKYIAEYAPFWTW